MTILTDSFILLHALLFWLRIKMADLRFILNKLWNKFLRGHISIFQEFLQKLVHSSGVSILDTHLTDTLFIHWNAQNIYSPKVILRMSCSEPCYYKKQILYYSEQNYARLRIFDHPSYISSKPQWYSFITTRQVVQCCVQAGVSKWLSSKNDRHNSAEQLSRNLKTQTQEYKQKQW